MVYIYTSLLLVGALSLDALAASFSYGASRIKIPFISCLTISLICTIVLGGSFFLGSLFFGTFSDYSLIEGIGAGLLISLGIYKLYDNLIKEFLTKKKSIVSTNKKKQAPLKILLSLYIDPKKADFDSSKSLSVGEAAVLSIILSIDSLVAGFSFSVIHNSIFLILGLSLVITCAFIYLGSLLGRFLRKKINLDLSWLSGLVLMALGLVQIVL